jgi:hypothetical protein
MFGMLDYRAHKLYLLMFGIPWFVLRWAIIIGLPFLYYGIGQQIAENRFLQIVASLVALFFIEILVVLGATYIDKLFMFVFNLFVDIIPADDRNKEEAILVVKSGQVAIKLIELEKKHPSTWTEEDTDFYHRGFFAWFFKNTIKHRINMIRDYFVENSDLAFNQWNIKNYLSKNNLQMSFWENIVTNATYRATAISYSITILLLILNPWE